MPSEVITIMLEFTIYMVRKNLWKCLFKLYIQGRRTHPRFVNKYDLRLQWMAGAHSHTSHSAMVEQHR